MYDPINIVQPAADVPDTRLASHPIDKDVNDLCDQTCRELAPHFIYGNSDLVAVQDASVKGDHRLRLLEADHDVHHSLHLLHLGLDEIDTTVAGHSLHPHPGFGPHLYRIINKSYKYNNEIGTENIHWIMKIDHVSPELPSGILCWL